MESARLKPEHTKSEPVPDRARLTPAPLGTVSRQPLGIYDAHSPALRLGQGVGSSHALAANGLQAKLTINEAGDQFEQEADRVAEQVMRMPDPAIRLQRKCGCGASTSSGESCPECASPSVQLQRRATPVNSLAAAADPSVVHDVLRSPGQPLDSSTRAFMERRFSQDFSDVRVHADKRGNESAKAVEALAYTVGRHVVFGAGQYAPHTNGGKSLLAHELAHVVQQGPNPVARIIATPGQQTLARPSPTTGKGPHLQRQRDPRARGATGRAGPGRQLVIIDVDVLPARIDATKGVDEITRDFYHIPVDLLPPNTPIPAGPILTIGPFGCGLRRYGLTVLDSFSLSYTLNERDIESSSRPFQIGSGSNLTTVEAWAGQVRFRARLRQTIFIPNDLASHLCTRDVNAVENRRQIMAHERLHEADNVAAVDLMRTRLREQLLSTIGIGNLMAMIRITDDRAGFVQECATKIRQRLDQLRDEHVIVYHRFSTEAAILRDPHDRELHTLKQQLLERARGQPAP